ncbi:MAG: hypothetical protein QOF48_1757 [Verrucomicrobiota bacterium]|jgi:hypothetical protein
MKNTFLLLSLTALIALPAAGADPSEDVKSAAKKLSEKSNYSWTATSQSPQTGGRQPAQGGQGRGRNGFGGTNTTTGKADKDGFALVSFGFGTNKSEAVIKGDKVAIKSGDEWKTGEELTADTGDGNTPGRGQFMVQRARRTKLPATDAQELVGKVKELKKDGDAYSGDLTADAVKQMSAGGGRGARGNAGGAAAPTLDTSGLKGTAKFWTKDGVLAKYETHITGKMTVPGRQGGDGREVDVNRTTTVEIKDVGTTKLDIPAEAKKKLKS